MDAGAPGQRIDRAKPDTLRRQGGKTLLVSMCEMFLESSVRRIEELGRTTDPAVVSRICHGFKTSSRLIGAPRLGELCERLEYATEDGGAIPAGAVGQLKDEYAHVQTWVEEVLREAAGVTPTEDVTSMVVEQAADLGEFIRPPLLPSVLTAAVMVVASLALWSALSSAEESALRNETSATCARIRFGLGARLDKDIRVLSRMSSRWEREGGTLEQEWKADARWCVAALEHLQAIEWVDQSFHVRWIAPLAGNEAAQDFDLSEESRRRIAMERARDEDVIVASEVIDLVQGGRGMLVFCPLFMIDSFDGFILGVYRLQLLLDNVLLQDSTDFGMRLSEDGKAFYTRGAQADETVPEEWAQTASIDFHGATWDIEVWPGSEAIHRQLTALPIVVLLGGCLAAVLSAIILHLGRTAARRAQQFEASNQRLLEAIQDRAATEAHALGTQQLESIGLLAGGIAHDFNNLLSGILGNADLARDSLPESSAARQPLDHIATIADRAADLCQQLLAYAGRGVFTMQPLDLGDIVRDMSKLLDITASKKTNLKMEIQDGAHIVVGDPGQLRQIVMNLVINASESLGPEDGRLAIRVGSTRPSYAVLSTFALGSDLPEERYVLLEVSDNGCGMDEEAVKKIFEPFFTTKRPGRGLGMAAVHGVARRHSGAIRVLSTPGRGTTVRVLLPASERSVPSGDMTGDEGASTAGVPGETILIVDDEADIRLLMRAMLEGAGYRVLSAADGQEALEVFAQEALDIQGVVLDLTMPRLDGASTLAALRSAHPDLPVVVCSGYGEQTVIEKVGDEDTALFLKKPFRQQELVAAVRRAIDKAPVSGES